MPRDLPSTLRLLADPARLRILRLLQQEELSVAELQEILGMGQSRISMQLSKLRQANLVELRAAGRKSLYRLASGERTDTLIEKLLEESSTGISLAGQDDEGLRFALQKRKDTLSGHFDELAGRFGRDYVPGRSWRALTEVLLRLLPPMVIADLGAGEATLALLLARHARRVIAVDSSKKMVEFGAGLARRNNVENLDYRLGDLEDLPIEGAETDLALFHQSLHHALHPGRAVAEAWRILRPGGTIVVVDLHRHGFEEAREMYHDVWLGFLQVELAGYLREAGFTQAGVSIVHREEDAPHFETILAVGVKSTRS